MIAREAADILERLGVTLPSDGELIARSPIDGSEIGRVATTSPRWSRLKRARFAARVSVKSRR